ncbi:hypothetical protein [Paraburkholderia sp.]|jgi:hypothetical protein|uniref:hypothetical protein n=1 Tax=Paraburkholderia sp. TaxID=1926495 RepID=UPI000EFC24AC|nr:hypothetical protein [Paraburkholderia sp.]
MTPATIAMLRAYLMTASLAAAAIQMAALLSIGLFGVPEAVFTSGPFRLAATASIVCIVLLVKRIARAAFLSALSLDYATITDTHSNATSVSPVCPVRMLVILHLRFNRRPIEWATC